MSKNRGYTLIEAIIVIAIIAIMAGVSGVTFGIVKKAQCNAAINNFNNQLTALWIKTQALSQGKEQTSPRAGDLSTYPMCMKVERNTDTSDDIRDNSYVLYLGYEDSGGSFVRKKDQAGNEEQYLCIIPNFITVEYRETPTSTPVTDGFVIRFNKADGSVIKGSGSYKFIYGDSEYGTIILNKVTGNHYMDSATN